MSDRYPPWKTAAVTVLVGPLLGLVAAYFYARWATEAGESGRRHWQTWAITSVVVTVAYMVLGVI